MRPNNQQIQQYFRKKISIQINREILNGVLFITKVNTSF